MYSAQIGVDAFEDNGINYPFVAHLPELPYLIEDLHVSSFKPAVPALWLRWYHADVGLPVGVGVPPAVNSVDLLLEDDNHEVVFDTRLWAFTQRLWAGSRYLIP